MSIKGIKSKEAIVKNSLEEFANKSYDLASINSICQKHSITKGQLYHHFKSKADLYDHVISYVYDVILAYHKENFIKVSSVKDSIENYFRVRFEFFKEEPELGSVFLRNLRQDSKNTKRLKFTQYNKNVFEEILSDAVLNDGLNAQQVISYYVLVMNAFNSKFEFISFNEYEKEVKAILNMMLYGSLKSEGDVC